MRKDLEEINIQQESTILRSKTFINNSLRFSPARFVRGFLLKIHFSS